MKLLKKIYDAEAIFFVAGSRRKDLLMIDLNGAPYGILKIKT